MNVNRSKLIAFTTASFPSLSLSFEVIKTVIDSGVDLVEIGIPFSDPVADGLVIQASSSYALRSFEFKDLWQLLEWVRGYNSDIELSIMTCINPILSFGVERFLEQCVQYNVKSTILSDVPYDAFVKDLLAIYDKYGIANNFLITTATNDKRLKQYDTICKGFLYLVTAPAITGMKVVMDHTALKQTVDKVESPCYIGFGIDSPSKAKELAPLADGLIIGSEIIRIVSECILGDRFPDSELQSRLASMTIPSHVDLAPLARFIEEVKEVI